MSWDWDFAASIMPTLMRGLLITFWVTILASIIAVPLGLGIALLGRMEFRAVRIATRFLVEIVRGSPIPIQLFFVFYGLPAIGLVLPPMPVGIGVLGLHYACYTADVWRGGIAYVPKGILEAADALHLPSTTKWFRVILPIAARVSLPSLGNYVLIIYKQSALLVIIGVPVLLDQAKVAGYEYFRYLEPYTIAGLLYLMVNIPSVWILRRMERSYAY